MIITIGAVFISAYILYLSHRQHTYKKYVFHPLVIRMGQEAKVNFLETPKEMQEKYAVIYENFHNTFSIDEHYKKNNGKLEITKKDINRQEFDEIQLEQLSRIFELLMRDVAADKVRRHLQLEFDLQIQLTKRFSYFGYLSTVAKYFIVELDKAQKRISAKRAVEKEQKQDNGEFKRTWSNSLYRIIY